jgi:hypothetical protein
VKRRFAAATLSCWLLAASVPAGDVALQTSNVFAGAQAARAQAGSTCTSSLDLGLEGSPGAGTWEGCRRLTSTADHGAGATTYRAGEWIALANGFSIAAGASLTCEIDSALDPDEAVDDGSPSTETLFAARFYLDADGLDLLTGERLHLLTAHSADGSLRLRVGLRQVVTGGGERRLFLEVVDDQEVTLSTEGATELTLPDGWHWMEVGWAAATFDGADDGSGYLCLDDLTATCAMLTSLDNDEGSIDHVRWGAVDVPPGRDLGHVDLDEFESRRGGLIGGV